MSFKDAIQRAIERKKQELEQREMIFTEDLEAGQKIIFTGLANSGKSSIILSFAKEIFENRYPATYSSNRANILHFYG